MFLNIWTPYIGEKLTMDRVYDNPHDRYAIAIRRDGRTVGRIPREFSKHFSKFLSDGAGGVITCEVSGKRKKGKSLEVPCLYVFTGTRT